MPDKTCLVIGAGPAGLAAAETCRKRGVSVMLVDLAEYLRGKTFYYGCKASAECTGCGVCAVDKLAVKLSMDPKIDLHLKTRIHAVIDETVKFEIHGECDGKPERYISDYLVIATGFSIFDLRRKLPYNYGRLPDVISGTELEYLLSEDMPLRTVQGTAVKSLAFIQCAGSRDRALGHTCCSQVCCPYAIRIAGKLAADQPDLKITIFTMDLQASTPQLKRIIDSFSPAITINHGLPGEVLSDAHGGLEIVYERDHSDHLETTHFDMVVLSHGIHPLPLPDEIVTSLNIKQNPDGFYLPVHNARFALCGTACGPMNIATSMQQSKNAVHRMLDLKGEES